MSLPTCLHDFPCDSSTVNDGRKSSSLFAISSDISNSQCIPKSVYEKVGRAVA